MTDENVRQQIERLAARLERIERTLGITAPPVAPAPTQQPAPTRQPATPPTTPVTPSAVPQAAPAPAAPPSPAPAMRPLRTAAIPPRPASPHVEKQPVGAAAVTERPRESQPGRSLEMMLGLKWTAALGAIIVVLGAGFAIREFGTGLWHQLGELGQALIVAAFGAVLIAAGEFAYRRINRAASAGLIGAGLGVLYLDAFAASQWFSIVGHNVSFLLMGLTALIGFALTVRTRFLTIGVLSMIGGYLTPLLLSGGQPQAIPLLSYMTMLPAIALGLSAVMPRPFVPLRYLALGGQVLIGLPIIIAVTDPPISAWLASVIFISMWWTMFIAEALYAALRERTAIGNAVSSLLATAAYVTVVGWVLVEVAPAGANDWLGGFAAMVGVLSAAAALHFGPGFDTLRGRLIAPIDKLAVALWAQCGVLLALAVAIQFDDYGASIGWLALALAAIEIGRRLPSPGVTIFGLIVGSLSVLRIALLDMRTPAMNVELWSWMQVMIDTGAILALGAVIAVHVAARRMGEHRGEGWLAMPTVLSVIGTFGWLLLCGRQTSGLAMTGGWLIGVAVLFAAHRAGRRQHYFEIGQLLLALTAARWLLIDAFAQRTAPGWDALAALPMLNAQMALAIVIAVLGWWGFKILRARMSDAHEAGLPGAPVVVQAVLMAGLLFFLIALSFEADRLVLRIEPALNAAVGHVRQIAFTMLWCAGAAASALMALTFVARQCRDRTEAVGTTVPLRFAWVLLIGVAVKWLVIDTLAWAFMGRAGALALWPLANVQALAGLLIAGTAMLLLLVQSRDREGAETGWASLAQWIPVGASVVLLWGLTFEVDRVLGRMAIAAERLWPAMQERVLCWIGLWALGGLAMMLIGLRRSLVAMVTVGWAIVVAGAVMWLTGGTLLWRVNGVIAATVLFNVQFLIGAATAVMLALAVWLLSRSDTPGSESRATALLGFALMAAIGLWLGSFEIDRFFSVAGNTRGLHMGLSVWWALYGVMLVMIGFMRDIAPSRYVGLGLLAVTIAKAFIVDLTMVDQVWRVVSFIALGLLLIATSVAYALLAPRLLATLRGAGDRM
jgi:uncharacterized membrane protein